VRALLARHDWDYFIGSVHHVHAVPIDFDVRMYRQARAEAGGTDAALFEAYFDAQHEMLRALRPPVVGHFDLVRLYSDDPDEPLETHEGVWSRVLRNLRVIQSYGGLMELNSSAVRKGLAEPYPSVAVCKVSPLASVRCDVY
jgi:histidinol-phosphatase (PHP family)